jgi:Ca2+-binding RTX toxin-like protein
MPMPTAEEQLTLELVNAARADPGGEVDRLILDRENRIAADSDVTSALTFFDVDIDLLVAQLAEFEAVAPLAWNDNLGQSADTHSELMISFDEQSHNLPGEPGLLDRTADAGYENAQRIGENVFAFSQSTEYGHAGFIIDWGFGPGGIQDPAGHRNSLLSANFTEIGISILEENDVETSVGPFVVTQHLGTRFDYNAQLLGVVIDDTDNDDFYDIGEGLGGVTVTAVGDAGTFTTTTWDAGGYQIELAAGTYEVTFSGGALDGTITQTVQIGTDNVKLDAEADDAVSAVSNGVARFGAEGDDTLQGTAGEDTLNGGGGGDHFEGGEGFDIVSYEGSTRSVRLDLLNDRHSFGDAVGDTFDSIEAFQGGDTRDQLRGSNEADIFYGGGGVDRLYGRRGDDILDGQGGIDALYGGLGADTMTGGEDNARDRFIYFNIKESGVGAGNRDVITDFVSDQDRIEISRFDADVTQGFKQSFNFLGDAAFSNTAGELRYGADGGITLVQADTNGDGLADFEIELVGDLTLSASDFLI